MATVQKLETSMMLPVIDALTMRQRTVTDGKEEVQVVRKVHNPPFAWMFPENKDDIVVLDWGPFYDSVVEALEQEAATAKQLGKKARKDSRQALEVAVISRLKEPTIVNGKEYHIFGWGSGAKDKQTLGMTKDFLREIGLVRFVEDYARVARAIMPNGLYGGGVVKARVFLAPENTVVGPHRIADGCGFMPSDIYAQLRNEQEGIHLGDGNQNFQIWQHFAFNEAFKAEFEAQHEQMKKDIQVMPESFVSTFGEVGEYKNELLAADPFMIHHPMFSAPLKRGAAEMLNQVATTMYLPGKMKVVVPSRYDFFVIPLPGKKFILVRWPVDAVSNVQAIKVDLSDPRYKEELDRLNSLEAVAQTSMTSKNIHAKNVVIVGERFTDEYDIAMTVSDVKMVAGCDDIDQWRKDNAGTVVEMEFFVSITQVYGPDSIAFTPFERWKKLGGDWDGDMLFVMCVDHLKEVFRQAWEWRDRTNSAKIPKSHTNDFSLKEKFLYSAWGNGVGFAVNVMAATYVEQPQFRKNVMAVVLQAVPKLFSFLMYDKKGKKLDAPWRNPETQDLDYVLNRAVKLFTDIFKTMAVDPAEEEKTLHQIQSAVAVAYDGLAAWIGWRRSTVAFRTEVPDFLSNLTSLVERAKEDKEFRRSESYRIHIPIKQSEATIAQIFKLVRPWVLEQFMKMNTTDTMDVLDALKTAPLCDFVNWAPVVPDKYMLVAKSLIGKFNALQVLTNFDSAESIDRMKTAFNGMVEQAIVKDFRGSRQLAAYALWRSAHHSRSSMAGATSVFFGLPNEALMIVRRKPGLIGEVKAESVGESIELVAERYGVSVDLLKAVNGNKDNFEKGDKISLPRVSFKAFAVGVKYNFTPQPRAMAPFTGEVRQVEYGNQLRLVILSDEILPNQKGSELGSNVVAMVGRNDFTNELDGFSAPTPGRYSIVVDRKGNTDTWIAHFSPI